MENQITTVNQNIDIKDSLFEKVMAIYNEAMDKVENIINSIAKLFVDDVITLEQAKAQIEEKNIETLNRTIMQMKIKKGNNDNRLGY